MEKLLLATGKTQLDNIIENKIAPTTNCEVVERVSYKRDLLRDVKRLEPDIVIISKMLSGTEVTILETILTVKTECPHVRIIYLAGAVDEKDREKMSELSTLVMAGVYDIIHEQQINVQLLSHIIKNPKTREQVSYLTKNVKTHIVKETEVVEFEEEEVVEDIEENGYKNVFLVSSIKPRHRQELSFN